MKTLFVDSSSAPSVQALSGALFALTEDNDSVLKEITRLFARPIRAENTNNGFFLVIDDHPPFCFEHTPVSSYVIRRFESILSRADSAISKDGNSALYLLICCYLMEIVCPRKTVFSPIGVGKCASDPTLLKILDGAAVSPSKKAATYAFASFAREYASDFGEIPRMYAVRAASGVDSCGGFVTAVLGDVRQDESAGSESVQISFGENERKPGGISELTCNVDDMTPEALGFAMEMFFKEGALEVYTIPLTMKKSRPGVLLTVMCRAEDCEKMIRLFFKHTTTLGVRETYSRRHTLSRSVVEISTSFGPVRKKISEGFGVLREKYEYEDLSAVARENGISLEEARERILREDGGKNGIANR